MSPEGLGEGYLRDRNTEFVFLAEVGAGAKIDLLETSSLSSSTVVDVVEQRGRY